MFKPLFTSTLETTINKYLALNADRQLLLAPIAGSTIAITFAGTTLYLCPSHDSIQLLDKCNACDCTISGDLPAIAKFMLGKASQVSISGDDKIALQLQTLTSHLQIDFAKHLPGGDDVFPKIKRFFQSSAASAKLNWVEFLQQETDILPSRFEVSIFSRQLRILTSDLESLANRLESLAKTRR